MTFHRVAPYLRMSCVKHWSNGDQCRLVLIASVESKHQLTLEYLGEEMMADQSFCENIDTTILVLHPSSAPHVVSADGALEFEEEGALILPVQKQLKDSLVRALNEYVSVRKADEVAIEYRLRVDPDTDIEFPATHVIRLSGPGATASEVEEFRKAARFILSELVPQRTLGDSANEDQFGDCELEALKALGEDLVVRFASRSIKQGVMVRFGGTELQGVIVQGAMPSLTVTQGSQGVLRGMARPVGFDERKGSANLWVIRESCEDGKAYIQGRIEVLCHELDLLRIVASAYANRSLVEYEVLLQPGVRKNQMVITVVSLKEIAVNDVDNFRLQ